MWAPEGGIGLGYKEVPVLANAQIAENVYSMLVQMDDDIGPGQFYMLRRPDSTVLLPRAISVCDSAQGKVRFVYELLGEGTKGFSRLRPGDRLCVNGPLGNSYPVGELRGRVALVGGSSGIAPFLYTARVLRERGLEADAFAGFAAQSFLGEDLREVADRVHIATESGAEGHKGLVTDLLEPAAYGTVLVCGPRGLMRAVVERCLAVGTRVYLSMEAKMACGMGACLVCSCAGADGKNRRACKDGPIFRGEEIDFDA